MSVAAVTGMRSRAPLVNSLNSSLNLSEKTGHLSLCLPQTGGTLIIVLRRFGSVNSESFRHRVSGVNMSRF